jgi:hypothetical protein
MNDFIELFGDEISELKNRTKVLNAPTAFMKDISIMLCLFHLFLYLPLSNLE